MLEDTHGAKGPLEIGLMYAHTCNIKCRHCGILSGPKNRNRMTMELAELCIRQASELVPKPMTIVFTGGEPFLFLHELEHLIELANERGFSTRVVTNGFWGRNVSRARLVLNRLRLAGLDALNFSADKYHLEFLPPWVLKQAIAVSREVGYVAIVNFVINEPGDPMEQFSRLYGIPMEEIRLFNEQELADRVEADAHDPDLFRKINLSYGRLIGLGRSAEYPHEHYMSSLSTFSYQRCLEVVNRPVVYPNGDLQACCCAGGKIAAFKVGNLHSNTLADLVEIMRARSHYRFINNFGPRQLYETICVARPERKRETGHASICDICVAATKDMTESEIDSIIEHWVVGGLIGSQMVPRTPSSAELTESSEKLIWPTIAGNSTTALSTPFLRSAD